jgi:tRNA A-37 threonylcarbamoyl transferase component Bud32
VTANDETAPSQDSIADEAYCSACNASYASTLETCPRDGERLVRFRAQPDALQGRVIDERFEVRGRLGRGGMGTVYRAWQRSVEREVAIKVVDARLSHDRTAAKRFLREARLASRLNQPSIVNVYDFGQTEDGILYLVMELLRGRTLAQVIASSGPMPVRRAFAIGIQLCDALDAAHGQGIIHRDLKPQNVVVLDDPPGRDLVKVLDFGLAKSLVSGEGTTVTESDAMLGTPLYMAPETIEGRAADQRSDLYAIGCMLHELLTARPPFHGESRNLVLAMHLSASPPALPDGAPAEASGLIEELLAKDPADRPASAAHVRDRLQEILEAEPAATPRPSRPRPAQPSRPLTAPLALLETAPSAPIPAQPPSRRWLWLLGTTAVVAAAVVAMLRPWDQPPRPIIDSGPSKLRGADVVPGPVGPGAAVPSDLAAPVDAADLMATAGAPPDAGPPDAAPPTDAALPPDARARQRRAKASQTPAGSRDTPPTSEGEPEIDFILPK